jgi:membrane protease subunit HflK
MMLTRDENLVRIPMTVQYNVSDVEAFVLKVRDPEFSLREATDSALRHVVGSSTLNNTLGEGRQQIADEVKLRLQNYLDSYGTGIQIIEINIQEAQPPAEVADAFDDVVKAVEDEQRAKELAQAYANSIIPEARGRAQRMLEEAEAYKARVVAEAEGQARRFSDLLAEYEKAPEVTRERLYLDAVQQVMQNTSKVMVTSEGGNNILYLPLDQMASRSSAAQSDRAINMTDLVQRAADEVAARQERGVSRDTRRTREGR